MTFVIVKETGRYDSQVRPLFCVETKKQADNILELLASYSSWVDKRYRHTRQFTDHWAVDNPQTWTSEEARKWSSPWGYKNNPNYKNYKDRVDKWRKDKLEASDKFKLEFECPEKFSQILKIKGILSNDYDFKFSSYEVETIELEITEAKLDATAS